MRLHPVALSPSHPPPTLRACASTSRSPSSSDQGVVVRPGSPAFTITAPDVTILGPGVLDGGTANPSPGVLLQAGADNFTLSGVEVRNFASGVQATANLVSFRLLDNFIHNNAGAGLLVDSTAALSGVVTIEGNLFKDNGGPGVQNDNLATTLPAAYNSWGDLAGPGGSNGDGVGPRVTSTPFTFAEAFLDARSRHPGAHSATCSSSQTFSVSLKLDAASLYAVSFRFTYDPSLLTLNGVTFSAPWAGRCASLSSTAGVVAYRCTLLNPDAEYSATAGTVATFSFTANGAGLTGNGPWSNTFDLAHQPALTNAAARDGARVYVNNAGFNAPSAPARDITDADDGLIHITGIARFTGFVDLQGRYNDSGATLTAYSQQLILGATAFASGTSASSGSYTTANIDPHLLAIGSTYYFQVDAPLYLPTTAVEPSVPGAYPAGELAERRYPGHPPAHPAG